MNMNVFSLLDLIELDHRPLVLLQSFTIFCGTVGVRTEYYDSHLMSSHRAILGLHEGNLVCGC